MEQYECPCGYVYNPEKGDIDNSVEPETAFKDLFEEWLCPLCDSEQEYFELLD